MSYAIFLSLSKHVLREFIPFINSVDYFDHDELDVVVMHRWLPEKVIEVIESKDWRFNLKFVPLKFDENDSRKDKVRYCMAAYRYAHMAELGMGYDACVLLDADMILLSNIEDILEASRGKNIFGAKNVQNKRFEIDGVFKDFDGNPLIEHEGIYWNNVCAVPLFLNVNEHADILRKTTELTKKTPKDDYQMLNVAIHQLKKSEHVMPMKNSIWIGTQMSWFKEMGFGLVDRDRFDSRFKDGHCIRTHNDILVRSIHSRWWYNPEIENAIRYRIGKVFNEGIADLLGKAAVNDDRYEEDREKFIDRRLQYLKLIREQFCSFCDGKLTLEELER